MTIPYYTLVLGIDARHLKQLRLTWPTWARHKPSLLKVPMLVFYDREQVSPREIRETVNHPNLLSAPWPMDQVEYPADDGTKWGSQQRYKMLSGFVHVPASLVSTPYWLKLDTVVATGKDDWIDERWFEGSPAIVAHRWSFTKPAEQILELDRWTSYNSSRLPELSQNPPLNLVPNPGSDRVGHNRIISWCGFFNTEFTRLCSGWAIDTIGPGLLPVPSQDGFMWYCAKRGNYPIIRVNMKDRGWQQWSNDENVRKYSEEAMK